MAEIHQLLWSLAVHAAEHQDAQLVGDSLRYIKPVQVGIRRSRDKRDGSFSTIWLISLDVLIRPSWKFYH